jgi:hypothetical protein
MGPDYGKMLSLARIRTLARYIFAPGAWAAPHSSSSIAQPA